MVWLTITRILIGVVYLLTRIPKIFRFNTFDVVSECGDGNDEDVVYYELWSFFDLLRKTNTQIVEALYVEDFEVVDPIFKSEVLDNPTNWINSTNLVKSIQGYSFGEYRLAMGERTGKLGGKRFEQLQKVGFSLKNICQMIRLSKGLVYLQEHGVYPLRLQDHIPEVHDLALHIKTQPQDFTRDQVDKIAQECLAEVNKVEDKLGWVFGEEKSVDFMRSTYTLYL